MIISAKVAVLLAAYNGKRWIEEQITTILNQINVYVDIFISLDLSADNSLNIIENYIEKYSNITLLPYGNRFGSAAPNFYNLLLSVPIENYDYIALSDQDDIWFDNKLEKAIEKLNLKEASGYSSNVTAYWENGKRKTVQKAYQQSEYDYLFESPGPGCSFVLRGQLAVAMKNYIKSVTSLKGLDWHDWAIYAFARKNNYKWIIDNDSYILYRQHRNNQLGANTGSVAFVRRIKEIFSGYGINQTLRIIEFLNMENNPFVNRWYKDGKPKYLVLSMSANKCRRRLRDKFLFFFACIFMSVLRPQIKVIV